MLELKNLTASVKNKEILSGLSLKIQKGETHVIMGQNGCGKSTTLATIMGDENFSVKPKSIFLGGVDITGMDTIERSKRGIFLAFQSPFELPEMKTIDYLIYLFCSVCQIPMTAFGAEVNPEIKKTFLETYRLYIDKLGITNEMMEREFNVGFSGGEKKKMEVLQMLICNPKVAMLDEIDTGLDVDSIIRIGEVLGEYIEKRKDMIMIIVTHYSRFIKNIRTDYVHIIRDGKILKTGTKDLAFEIEEKGYLNIN